LAERPDDILKARVAVKAKVVTVYPGGEPLTWVPEAIKEGPVSTISKTGLKSEHITDFQRSKLYKILVGIWYNTFYSKEIHTYEEEAEETALHIHNLMREKFGIEKSIHRSGASHFNPHGNKGEQKCPIANLNPHSEKPQNTGLAFQMEVTKKTMYGMISIYLTDTGSIFRIEENGIRALTFQASMETTRT